MLVSKSLFLFSCRTDFLSKECTLLVHKISHFFKIFPDGESQRAVLQEM